MPPTNCGARCSRWNDRRSPEEFAAFRAWFAEFDASAWDQRIDEDASAGRLDALAEEAPQDLREGRCTDL